MTTTIPESSTSRQQPPIPDQSRACFSDSTPTGSYFRFRVFAVFAFFAVFAVFAFFAVFAVFAFSRFSRFRLACACITGGRDTRFVCTAPGGPAAPLNFQRIRMWTCSGCHSKQGHGAFTWWGPGFKKTGAWMNTANRKVIPTAQSFGPFARTEWAGSRLHSNSWCC